MGGVLRKIVAQEGVVIPVGDLIAVITAPDEPLPDDLGISPPAVTPPGCTARRRLSDSSSNFPDIGLR